MTSDLDPRLHAYRYDLADLRLEGRVEAERFVAPQPRCVVRSALALKAEPSGSAETASEVLFGETFLAFEDRAGWTWGQLETDGYVGYVATEGLGPIQTPPTHRVSAVGTFLYPEPDLKTVPAMPLSMGSRLALGDDVETRGTTYLRVEGGGAVIASHVIPVDTAGEQDVVAVAERFLHTPYLWGGRTGQGLDCSALVQLALMATGHPAPRDSDLQEAMLGKPVDGGVDAPLHTGDLVFWPGHVGIMIDGEYLLHASGHQMMVVIEPLGQAVARIETSMGRPSSVKRL